MAGEERSDSDRLISPEDVVATASRYGFVQLVSLLERLHPDAPRVGGLGPVQEEVIRFHHDPALAFAAGDVNGVIAAQRAIDPTSSLSPTRTVYEVMTTFLGLTGATTPLPTYFAEEVALDDSEGATQRQFLDLFHHRLLALFYRLRSRLDFATDFSTDMQDAWSKRMLALAGVDTYELPPTSTLPRWRLLRLSPLLAPRVRTSRTLQIALEDTLSDVLEGATVGIEQFVGRWVGIDPSQRMKLGLFNSTLGVDSVVGDKIFDRGGKFRIVLSPLSANGFRRFLPDGDQIPVVKEVVGLFCRDQLDFDMELVLARDATPPFRLSAVDGSRLGLDAWLGARDTDQTRVIVEVTLGSKRARGSSTLGDPGGDFSSDAESGSASSLPLDSDFDPSPPAFAGASH